MTARLVACVIAAELCSMVGFSTFAATLTELSALWHLDPSDAGWISAAYNIGYLIAVPVLVGLTDRRDARSIYAVASVIGILGAAGFALGASGFWSALLCRALSGIALAGTYMPGLQLLTSRVPERLRFRIVPYYTATFGLGVSVSFLLSGSIAGSISSPLGWKLAFAAGALGCVLALVLVMIATRGTTVIAAAPAADRHPLDLRPAFRNREALVYIVGYFGHCWELFAFRAWLSAFLVFVFRGAIDATLVANHWATLIVLIGAPASIIGAEVASRRGRLTWVRVVASASVLVGVACGLASNASIAFALAALFLYNVLIAADSGALTTGALAASRPGESGATLAVHSILGFLGGAIGPLAAGFALDAGGGMASGSAWTWAFCAMAVGSLCAVVASLLVSTRGAVSAARAP